MAIIGGSICTGASSPTTIWMWSPARSIGVVSSQPTVGSLGPSWPGSRGRVRWPSPWRLHRLALRGGGAGAGRHRGPAGRAGGDGCQTRPKAPPRLATAELSPAGQQAVQVGLRQLDRLTAELDPLRADLARFSRRQPGCRALRTTHFGIGPITSVAIWAEMGDTRRFCSSDDAVRHAGLDITVYASDTKRARAASPGKGRPRCAGRCLRQPCAPAGRTRPTMPTSWRSSAGPTATWA